MGEHRDAEKEGPQDGRHPGHGGRHILGLRRPKGWHPVGDGLHARQRRTARGKRPQQEEQGEARDGRWDLGCLTGRGASQEQSPEAHQENQEEAADKKIGGPCEGPSRFPDSAEVDDGDDANRQRRMNMVPLLTNHPKINPGIRPLAQGVNNRPAFVSTC